MITSFLKTILLVNGLFAVICGIFVEICHACTQANVSPWLSVPATMAVCGFAYAKTIGVIARRYP